MERGFSAIAIKSLDDEQRLIRGVASTVEPDRQLDIVEPLGLRFKNPVSLLWQHRHDSPVGSCQFERPTKAGINFSAKLPKVDEPGTFKDQVDHAWHAVRAGAVRFVSIGFLPLEAEPLNTGGTRFKRAELLELSLVSVPANPGATITEVKAIDAAVRRGEFPSPMLSSSRKAIDEIEFITSHMEELRKTRSAKNDKIVTYSQGQHDMIWSGLQMAFAGLATLRNMIGELEDKGERRLPESDGLKYQGVWEQRKYSKGSIVTWGGSAWHANRETSAKPDEDREAWTLMVKRGRDGKDLRS